jgi:hypothetical protein
MTYAVSYTVVLPSRVELVTLSGLDADGLVEAVIYSAMFGRITNVSISTY